VQGQRPGASGRERQPHQHHLFFQGLKHFPQPLAEVVRGQVSGSGEDDLLLVPLDQAALRRPGSDVTILSWLLMLHFSLDAAQQLTNERIAAEVLDVRSLAPIDYQTIGDSVKKTGRVVIVEEGPKTGGASAEIAAGIQERFAQYLKAPVIRVASPDIPVPFSPILENAYRPSVAQIVQAVRAVTTPHAKPQRRKG